MTKAKVADGPMMVSKCVNEMLECLKVVEVRAPVVLLWSRLMKCTHGTASHFPKTELYSCFSSLPH